MAEDENPFIRRLNNNEIVGRLRTVHSEHQPGTCPGFSYVPNLIPMGTIIPFSFYHFDIESCKTV